MPGFTIENFVHELRDTLSAPDPKVAVDAVAEGVRRLLGGSFFPSEAYLEPSSEGFARHELYRDARVSIVTCVWMPLQSTPIHDHVGWGVIAALTGRIIATNYRRMDDGATPGFASIGEVSRVLVTDASYATLQPSEEQIHRFENTFRETAVTVHVYGADALRKNVYDPKAKSLTPSDAPAYLGV